MQLLELPKTLLHLDEQHFILDIAYFGLDAESVLLHQCIDDAKLLVDSIPEVMVVIEHNGLVDGIHAVCLGHKELQYFYLMIR